MNPNDEHLISAIRNAKTHTYQVDALFETIELKRRVGKWHLATQADVDAIEASLEKSYSICVKAAKTSAEPFRLIRAFEEEIMFADCSHLQLAQPRSFYEYPRSLEERIAG